MHVPMCVFAHPPMLKHISMDEISKIEFKKKKFKIAKAIATPRALFMLSKWSSSPLSPFYYETDSYQIAQAGLKLTL